LDLVDLLDQEDPMAPQDLLATEDLQVLLDLRAPWAVGAHPVALGPLERPDVTEP